MNVANISLETQCFLSERNDALALTFNVHENAIYYSENRTKTISRVKFAAGEGPEIIIGGTGEVEGELLSAFNLIIAYLSLESNEVFRSLADSGCFPI